MPRKWLQKTGVKRTGGLSDAETQKRNAIYGKGSGERRHNKRHDELRGGLLCLSAQGVSGERVRAGKGDRERAGRVGETRPARARD